MIVYWVQLEIINKFLQDVLENAIIQQLMNPYRI